MAATSTRGVVRLRPVEDARCWPEPSPPTSQACASLAATRPTVYDVPQTTIPGHRQPASVPRRHHGASQVDVLAGSEGVAQYGLDGKSFPAPADSLHDPLPEGRSFAYLLGMGRQNGAFMLDADPAEFLTGLQAATYCAGLGDADCEIDYTIANPDGRIKFGTVPPTAKVVLVDRANCCDHTIEVTVAELATGSTRQAPRSSSG